MKAGRQGSAGQGQPAAAAWRRHRAIGVFALIFGAIILLHLPLLRLPYYWDEAGYFIPAARDLLLTGSIIPKTTLSNAHPPLLMFWLTAWWKLAGYAPAVTRTAMLALAAFGLLGVYRLAERVTNRQVAIASLVLTAIYPVVFAQSSLAQLDIAAFTFTTWAVFFYISGKRKFSIVCSALATLSKETAFITPLALCLWEVLCWIENRSGGSAWVQKWCLYCPPTEEKASGGPGTISAALAQLLAALPLVAWYAFHGWHTGRLFGDDFLLRNLSGSIDPARIPLAFIQRLWHAAGHMNLFMLTAAALLASRLPSLPESDRGTQDAEKKPRSSLDRRVQAIFLLLIGAYVLMLSLVGGPLARYMIPVLPLVIVLAVAELRRALPFWRAWCAVCAAGFVLALLLAPPWRIAPEDNLTYTKFVRLHQQAAAYLEQHYARDRILTAWPASDELNRPFLGFVSHPLTAVRIDHFSGGNVLRAAQQRQAFDVAFVFSTKYDPPGNPMKRLGWWNRLQERYFDYHQDLPPTLIASMLRGRIVWQRAEGAEWAAIIELDEIRNAKMLDPSPRFSSQAELLALRNPSCRTEDILEHGHRELAGRGVLVGRMIGRQQHDAVRHLVLGGVAEFVSALAPDDPAPSQVIEIGVETDSPERDHHFHGLKRRQLAIEVPGAIGDLPRRGLVVRRNAAHGGGDVGIVQAQAVVAVLGRRLRGEAGPEQHGIEKPS